jgi:hypothetical protein
MKRLPVVILAGMCLVVITAPVFAWEFSLTGEAEFRYRYFARQGSGDLFGGPAGINGAGVATGTTGFAGPVNNFVVPQGFSAKGADASISDERIWFFPELRINNAIRLRGEYWVTGTNLRGLTSSGGFGFAYPATNWTLPTGYSGWTIQNDGTNGNRVEPSGMSIGMWEKFWLTAQSPWGILAVGRRAFPFGLGWSCTHERDANTESWLLVIPYGPFTIGNYLHTRVAGGDYFVENAGATQLTVSPVGLDGGPVIPFPGAQATGTDKNRVRQDFGPFVVYRNGPVEMGFFQEWLLYADQHTNLLSGAVAGASVPAGPVGADDFNNGALQILFLGAAGHLNSPLTPIYGDINFVFGINYFKYFNGRFFFNAEYDYEYADIARKGGRPLTMYGEAWELEAGAICGPAKLSIGAFRSSGNDRRGGYQDVSSAIGGAGSIAHPGINVYDKFTTFVGFSGREQALAPYVWLLGIYGGGNNAFDIRGKPTWHDLMAYGARLDYAVAANLNVFGSFFYANRDSNTATAIGAYGAFLPVPARTNATGLQTSNVPDNYLGWEANVGVSWKLLEGLTFNSNFAYWQPGDWFKWAYRDYGSLNTVTLPTGTYAVNPNRGIDAIIGWQASVVADF